MLVFVSILLAAIGGGGLPIFIKLGVLDLAPLHFSAWRFFVAFLSLLPLLYWSGGLPREPVILRRPLLLAGLANAANVGFFALGIPYTSPVLTQILYLLVPIAVAICEFLIFGQLLSTRQILGVLVGLTGALICIVSRLSTKLSGEPYGIFLILLAVASSAAYMLLSRAAREHYSAMTQTVVMSLITAAVLLVLGTMPLSINQGGWIPESSLNWTSILYCGVIGGSVYYALMQVVIKKASAGTAGAILYLQPFATMVWAHIILAEQMAPAMLAGSILAVLGAYLAAKT